MCPLTCMNWVCKPVLTKSKTYPHQIILSTNFGFEKCRMKHDLRHWNIQTHLCFCFPLSFSLFLIFTSLGFKSHLVILKCPSMNEWRSSRKSVILRCHSEGIYFLLDCLCSKWSQDTYAAMVLINSNNHSIDWEWWKALLLGEGIHSSPRPDVPHRSRERPWHQILICV